MKENNNLNEINVNNVVNETKRKREDQGDNWTNWLDTHRDYDCDNEKDFIDLMEDTECGNMTMEYLIKISNTEASEICFNDSELMEVFNLVRYNNGFLEFDFKMSRYGEFTNNRIIDHPDLTLFNFMPLVMTSSICYCTWLNFFEYLSDTKDDQEKAFAMKLLILLKLTGDTHIEELMEFGAQRCRNLNLGNMIKSQLFLSFGGKMNFIESLNQEKRDDFLIDCINKELKAQKEFDLDGFSLQERFNFDQLILYQILNHEEKKTMFLNTHFFRSSNFKGGLNPYLRNMIVVFQKDDIDLELVPYADCEAIYPWLKRLDPKIVKIKIEDAKVDANHCRTGNVNSRPLVNFIGILSEWNEEYNRTQLIYEIENKNNNLDYPNLLTVIKDGLANAGQFWQNNVRLEAERNRYSRRNHAIRAKNNWEIQVRCFKDFGRINFAGTKVQIFYQESLYTIQLVNKENQIKKIVALFDYNGRGIEFMKEKLGNFIEAWKELELAIPFERVMTVPNILSRYITSVDCTPFYNEISNIVPTHGETDIIDFMNSYWQIFLTRPIFRNTVPGRPYQRKVKDKIVEQFFVPYCNLKK